MDLEFVPGRWVKLPLLVYEAAKSKPRCYLATYIALLKIANGRKSLTVPIKDIAEAASISCRSVVRAIKLLHHDHWIKRTHLSKPGSIERGWSKYEVRGPNMN